MILHDLNNGVLFHIKGEREIYRRENETIEGVACTNSKGETVHLGALNKVVIERNKKTA